MAKSKLRIALTRWAKPLELAGRRFLQYLLSIVLWLPRRPAVLPERPRILVVRLDPRIGNFVMLTPFLSSLKRSFPGAHTTVLCDVHMQSLLEGHPDVDAIVPYVKWRVGRGPFSLVARLRRERYDVCFDAGSFPGVAVTHPLMTRLSGAKLIVGPDRGALSRLYHVTVPILPPTAHEIQQRLQLLVPFAGAERVETMSYRAPEVLAAHDRDHAAFVRDSTPNGAERTVILAVGSRKEETRVEVEEWARVAGAARERGFAVTIVCAPDQRPLGEAVQHAVPGANIAPPGSLDQVMALFRAARAVVANDTGTSHLAVAVGARICVLFVAGEPTRFGHRTAGATWIDLRHDRAQLAGAVLEWLR